MQIVMQSYFYSELTYQSDHSIISAYRWMAIKLQGRRGPREPHSAECGAASEGALASMGEEADAALVAWVSTFPTLTAPIGSVAELFDGVALLEALSEIDSTFEVSSIKRDVGESWPLAAKNLRLYVSQLQSFYVEELSTEADLSHVDANAIAQGESADGARELVGMLIGAVLQTGEMQTYVERIMDLDETVANLLQDIAQEAMGRFAKIEEEEDEPTPRAASPVAQADASSRADEEYAGANISANYLDELEAKNDEIAAGKKEIVELKRAAAEMQDQMEGLVRERDEKRSNVSRPSPRPAAQCRRAAAHPRQAHS